MQVLVPGSEGRTYYRAKSLKTKTAGKVYNGKPLPVFTIRTEAEAKTKPFISVFESYKGEKGNSVESVSVEKRNDGATFTVLTVFSRDLSDQVIFQSVDDASKYNGDRWNFSGFFGVAGFKNKQLCSLYLGEGNQIAHSGYSLKSKTPKGAASMTINNKSLKIISNQAIEVGIPYSEVKKVALKVGNKISALKTIRSGKQLIFEVPAITDGEVTIY